MITDRNKVDFVTICCWISLLASSVTIVQTLAIQQANNDDANGLADATVRAFSPRVDYNNEWRPVGRGDPLKNDPTYDYSPPVLERVRYWADSSDKEGQKKKEGGDGGGGGSVATADPAAIRKTNSSKNEILLLGASSNERVRGSNSQPPVKSAVKNAKGEMPVLQPKYTSIRRSYYAHQLPTRLMPPPMQTIAPPQHMMKPAATSEYRHNMPGYMTASTMGSGMSTHSKPYYSTAATSPWTHTSSPSVMQHHQHYPQQQQHQHQQQHQTQRIPAAYDTHHQESVNYFNYMRPSTSSAQVESSYSPNAIRPSQNALKQSPAPRKPWVHELLQKELIKSVKPTMSATKYLMGTTKSIIYEQQHMHPIGISTTYAPLTFVTTATPPPRPTMYAYTSSPVFITPTTPTVATSRRPIATTTTTQATISNGNRLLIPTTSNLAYRPTVAPMEMTTDSLFSHYNQPEKPLIGPMYLIIEGHSKVKTYGKNELDPHQPKIVPIIPKREPIVRVGDPNEKRGTVETFQVKHLHTKTTPSTTTPSTPTTTTTTFAPKRTMSTTTTTVKPKATNHSVEPETSNDIPAGEPPTGMQGLLSLLDSSLGGFFNDEPVAPMSAELKPLQASDMKRDDTIYVTTTTSTRLRPVTTTTTVRPATSLQLQLDARVSSKADTITSLIDASDGDESEFVTTEPAPRELRQIFDYDQLPESRLKQFMDASFEDADAADSAGGSWLGSIYDDVDDEEYPEESNKLLKRIDKLVDNDEDDDEFEEFEEMDMEEDDNEGKGNEAGNFNLARAQTMKIAT